MRPREGHVVEALVVASLPELDVAHVRSEEGHVYVVGRETKGVKIESLREGQKLRCSVPRGSQRIDSAERVARVDPTATPLKVRGFKS